MFPNAFVGFVTEFIAESVGYTWVMLRWKVTEVREDLQKYTIRINNDLSEDVSTDCG